MAGKRKLTDPAVIVMANCRDCDWDCQYKEDAAAQGRKHARECGHLVTVERSKTVIFDFRPEKLKAARKVTTPSTKVDGF